MKIKVNPVISILVLYLLVSAYLIYAYAALDKQFATIITVDLAPLAQGLLIFAVILLAAAFFSLFRIPLFHYLFKMIHLWIVIITGTLIGLYFRYGYLLWDMFNTETEQSISRTIPVSEPGMFKPLIDLVQTGLNTFRDSMVNIVFGVALALAIIQIILYLPSSLRYVYHTHISPIKYVFKHVLVSVVLLVPFLFAANFYMRLDDGMQPQLEALIEKEPEQVKENENAFYPMLAIWMDNVKDRMTAGKQWLSDYQKMQEYFRKVNRPVNLATYPDRNRLVLPAMNTTDRAEINQLYIQRLTQNTAALQADIEGYSKRYASQLDALRQLGKYKKYQNPIKDTVTSFTQFTAGYEASILSLHRLSLLDKLVEYDRSKKGLVETIFSDYFFNQVVIQNSHDPVIKALYIEKQAISAEFLNSLLQNPAYQNDYFYKFIAYIPLMGKLELDNGHIARNRILFFKQKIESSYVNAQNAESGAEDIFDYTFKENMTLNCIYTRVERKLNLDGKNPLEHIRAQQINMNKPRLKNVIGDVICNASINEQDNHYYTRAVEVNGRILLLKAFAKSRKDGIKDLNMTAFVSNNSEKFYNPFTREGLKWDRENRRLYFDYNDGEKNIRVALD